MSRATRRVLFVDATAGAAGDMILGALVDAGAPLAPIRRALTGLGLTGWRLRSSRVERAHLAGRRIEIRVDDDVPGRRWSTIRRIIRAGGLPATARDRSLAIFRRLFEAEAEVHGAPVERVHLHEAGAVDAILDIVGCCLALEHLAPDEIVVSTMTTGFGEVRCAHGLYPVPAPATLNLVRGVPVRAGELEVERLTPTGAAILTTLADRWGPLPAMTPRRVGLGAGARDLQGTPNLLRVVLGDLAAREDENDADDPSEERVAVIECTLDDLPPQNVAHAAERLLAAGALDAHVTPVVMKKGRPGHLLTVIARPSDRAALIETLWRETSTLGIRHRLDRRPVLARRSVRVDTAWGPVAVKVGSRGDETLQVWPEYEDCAKLARRHDRPLSEIQRAALRAYERRARTGARVRRKRDG